METFTCWALRHRRLIVGFWLLITVVGILTASAATRAMDQKFSVPGAEGWETNLQIARLFDGSGGNAAPLVPVVQMPAGRSVVDSAARADLARVERTLARALPGARVAGFASTGDRAFVSRDGRTSFVIAYPRADPREPFGQNPSAEKAARTALRDARVAGQPVHLTGLDALLGQSGSADGPSVLLEALAGGLGALVVLAFVFGSFLAIVPLLMAVPAIMTSFLTVYGLTTVTGISPIVQYLIALIGLGVAIDYSLLVVVRWREELAHGALEDDAIVAAMKTAGRAVVFSGSTVAVGLLALVVLPLPFLRSVGIGGMLIPLFSVAVSLSLLPVVLHAWGSRLDWPHRRTDDRASAAWTRWAEAVVRRRWTAAGVAAVVLALLVAAATQLQPGTANPDTLAKAGPAKSGLTQLKSSGIGSGVLLPHEVLVPVAEAADVTIALARVPGISGVAASEAFEREGQADVLAFPVRDGSTSAGRDLVHDVRDAAREAYPQARLGGVVAQNADFIAAVYGSFPLMIALISIITFVLLARAFRSLLLPAKAVLLNIVSVGAAWGVLQLVWQSGHGSEALFGVAATGAISAWIPLMVFAFLFGLSMDYEVFILARMREEYDATGDTDLAVVRGIGRTGRLVTSAALILFLAFVSLASGPETDVKVLATGLAAGILIDATIVRALLVPAVVSLFGDWNWALPKGAARVLRVEPAVVRAAPPADHDRASAARLA